MKKSTPKEVHSYTLTTEACYNPFFLECDGLRMGEISEVAFFKEENGEGEVVATSKWFTVLHGGNKKFASISSNNDFKTVKLPYTDIPLRRKVSFDKDKAFYVKATDTFGERKIKLYLNVSELQEFAIEKSEHETLYNGTEIRTYDIVTFKVDCTTRTPRWDGEGEQSRVACLTCNYNYAKTDFGNLCDKFCEMSHHTSAEIRAYQFSELITKGFFDEMITLYNAYKEQHPEKQSAE